MTAKPIHPEVSAYAAGAAVGAAAMLLALLPHVRTDVPTAASHMRPGHVDALPAPARSQSLYAAAKIGSPPTD